MSTASTYDRIGVGYRGTRGTDPMRSHEPQRTRWKRPIEYAQRGELDLSDLVAVLRGSAAEDDREPGTRVKSPRHIGGYRPIVLSKH
jgi:hypothetical protein